MAHFALLWKARTIEKYRQNYENEKYLSLQETNTPIPQKSLSQRLRCYRQDTQKRFSKIFQKIYPEGSSLSHFFLYMRTDQSCLNLVFKSFLGFLIGLALTYLCFLFFLFQLSISPFHATVVSSIIGVLLSVGLAFSYRIRCLIFLLLPQFFSRAGRYTLTCYALVLILTGPATNTLKNSEVLTESMACRQEQIKTLIKDVTQTARKPLNSIRDSIKIMMEKIRLFTRQLKGNLLKVNRLTLSVLETIHSIFLWLRWLSDVCNETMGSPYERCIKVLKEGSNDYKKRYKPNIAQIKRLADRAEEICSNVKKYKAICVFTDFVNGSFVASIKRRLKEFSQRIKDMLYLQIHVHHSYSFPSNTSDSASQVAAGIVTEIRKRADPLLTWLSWSSCVTSLFILLIIFRGKYYQHMFETRSRFDNKYITKEIRDLDLTRLRHGRETILPLNRRERSKYVSTTSFRLVASEKIHLNRSIVFMTITTFKLLIHMVADYSLYWVLMTIQHNGKNQTPMPYGVPNAGMHITGTGGVADMFRSLLTALTSSLEIPHPLPSACLPNPNPPDFQRYTQIGILIFLLWFFSLFEPYGLRLRHVVMGLYRPERAKARAEWLYNHILRLRGGFMKCARRKLHRTYKYHSEEKYTFKKWSNIYIPSWLRYILRIRKEEIRCLLCRTKEIPEDPNTKFQKCDTKDCPGVYCTDCFTDIGELCTICLSPRDYDDLSDASFEKGSSDESEDDSGEERAVKKHLDESDKDIFDCENNDIILPKPLRDKSKYQNMTEKSEADIKPNDITDIKKQTFNMKTYHNFITSLRKVINPLYKNKTIFFYDFEANTILKKLLQNKASRHYMRETKKMSSDKKTHNNNKKRNDSYKPRDVTDRKIDNKENKNDRTDKANSSTSKDLNMKNKESKIGQDKIIKHEIVSWCNFNRFNTMIYACWPNIKLNFNACKLTSQAIVNKNLGYDKNFKTRKKDEMIRRRTENENARQYRIFAYLADQDWVVKKTITYKSTEKECSLDSEKPNNDIQCLKEDILRQNIYLMDTDKEPALKAPNLEQHVFICDHCKYQCFCPENPINLLDKSKSMPIMGNICQPKNDIVEKDHKPAAVTASKSKENVSEKPCKSDDPNPKKLGFMSRMIRCLKSTCCMKTKKVKKVEVVEVIEQVEDIKIEKKDEATSTQRLKVCTAKKKKRKKPQPQNHSTMYRSDAEYLKELITIDKNFELEGKDESIKNSCYKGKPKVLDCINNDCKNKIDTEKQKDLSSKCKNVKSERKEVSIKNKSNKRTQEELNCKNKIKIDKQNDSSTKCKNVESERKELSTKNKSKQKGPYCKNNDCKNNIEIEKNKELLVKCKDVDDVKKKSDTEKRKGQDTKKKFDTEKQIEVPKKNKTCTRKPKKICTKCKGDAEICKQQTFHEHCDDLCPVICKCGKHGIIIEKCDPLCPEECTCNKKGVVVEKCDPLCPEECTCNRKGVVVEKCDPLCPEECTCNGKGVVVEKCDPLCPEDCTCGRQGITTKQCDPLCPENCTCDGHGVAIEPNYLCSGDCCCKDIGIQGEQRVSEEYISDASVNSSYCELCGRTTKRCPNCHKKISSAKENVVTPEEEISAESSNNSFCDTCGHNIKICPKCLQYKSTAKKYAYHSPSDSVDSCKSIQKEGPTRCSGKYHIFDKKPDNKVSKCNSNRSRGDERKQTRKQSQKYAKKDKGKQVDKIKPDSCSNIQCCPPFDYVSCDSERTLTPDEMYCSCAIQCPPLNRPRKITEQYCNGDNSEDEDEDEDSSCCCSNAKRSFTTVRHVYIERTRKKRVRRTIVSQRNQCIGTDTALKRNVATITKEKGLAKKNIVYVPEDHGIYLWDNLYKQDRAVSTKKTVSFGSRVQLIPSGVLYIDDYVDIYTPSRYLLESQKYYNELFTDTYIYPVNISQKCAQRRTSSYGSRSYSWRRCSYVSSPQKSKE